MERRYSLLPSFTNNFVYFEEGLDLSYSKEVKTHKFKNLNSLLSSKFPIYVTTYKKFIQTFYLPLIDFYLKYPQFDYYWQLEDDLIFNGDFSLFFESSFNWNHDLIVGYTDNSPSYNVCLNTPEHSIINYQLSKPLAFSFVAISRWSNLFIKHMVELWNNNSLGHVESFPLTVAILDNFKVGELNKLTPMFNSQYCNWNTLIKEKDLISIPSNTLIHSYKLNEGDKLFINR